VVARLRLLLPEADGLADAAADASLPERIQHALLQRTSAGGGGPAAADLAERVVRLEAQVARLDAALAEKRAVASDLQDELDAERRRRAALVERAAALEAQLFAARQELAETREYLPALALAHQLSAADLRSVPWTPYQPSRRATPASAAETEGDTDDEF